MPPWLNWSRAAASSFFSVPATPISISGFAAVARTHGGSVGVELGYDEGPLASDHRRRRCPAHAIAISNHAGLTQLYALRYGTLPLVHRVGGLADTVVVGADAVTLADGTATGFTFDEESPQAPLASTIGRAAVLFPPGGDMAADDPARDDARLQLARRRQPVFGALPAGCGPNQPRETAASGGVPSDPAPGAALIKLSI